MEPVDQPDEFYMGPRFGRKGNYGGSIEECSWELINCKLQHVYNCNRKSVLQGLLRIQSSTLTLGTKPEGVSRDPPTKVKRANSASVTANNEKGDLW